MASEDLLKKAVAAFNALSPEQQAEMLEEQRQSWVRGNIGLSRDERGMTSPVTPQPTTVMVSELKPWRYEIKYGPDGEDSYSWVYDDQGVMVAPMRTNKAKEVVDRMNTRPAQAATDTGLVTVMKLDWVKHPTITLWRAETILGVYQAWTTGTTGWLLDCFSGERIEPQNALTVEAAFDAAQADFDARIFSVVTRSQAEELLAAKDKEIASLIPRAPNCGRYLAECNDGRLLYLNHANTWQECPNFIETKNNLIQSLIDLDSDEVKRLEADNAAQAARVKELETERDEALDDAKFAERIAIKREIDANASVEALEAKLAAAEKALEPFADHAKERAVDAPEWRDTDTVRIVVTIGDLRKARAVLGGKP